MRHAILFESHDGRIGLASTKTYESVEEAERDLNVATDISEKEARVSDNPLARLATDEDIKSVRIGDVYAS